MQQAHTRTHARTHARTHTHTHTHSILSLLLYRRGTIMLSGYFLKIIWIYALNWFETRQYKFEYSLSSLFVKLRNEDSLIELCWLFRSHCDHQYEGLFQSHYDQYEGFVVLHGTDTMAYTASALSFMCENLGKPVILTGSQVSTERVDSMGDHALLCVLQPFTCSNWVVIIFEARFNWSGCGIFVVPVQSMHTIL